MFFFEEVGDSLFGASHLRKFLPPSPEDTKVHKGLDVDWKFEPVIMFGVENKGFLIALRFFRNDRIVFYI